MDDDFRPTRKAHVVFLVDGFETLLGKIRDASFDIDEYEPLEGYSRAFVNDPFGNRIEFMQQPSAAK